MISRRTLLQYASTSLIAASWEGAIPVGAESVKLPLGLQLFSVRELLPGDFDGTLRRIGSLGYRVVEAAGFFEHTPSQVRLAMHSAGLRCVSAHYAYGQLHSGLDEIIDFGKQLGLEYIICSSPGLRDPSRKGPGQASLSLDDWRWNAEQFNQIGEKVHAAGLRFGYHNHTREFQMEDGVLPYNELLRLTDPSKVTMEMDCGWVVVGGQSPVEYLTKYSGRFSLLHIKDFKLGRPGGAEGRPPVTELGRGSIDYGPIFRAAKKAPIQYYFVEQEAFDMPPFESLKIDADYMRKLRF